MEASKMLRSGKATLTKHSSTSSATTIDAAALQDHLLRSLAVDLSTPGAVKRKVDGSVGVSKMVSTKVSTENPLVPKITKPPILTRPAPLKKEKTPLEITAVRSPHDLTALLAETWICDGCGATNKAEACACPCGRGKAGEYAVKAVKLTLAQQRGLVPAPPGPLSATEWQGVEAAAKARLVGDAADSKAVECDAACAICMEPFGLRDQVLLSCTHSFHRSCIESYERFIGESNAACPICRTKGYQKRRTRQAALLHVQTCIVKIQAVYRGYVTRCRFYQLRKQLYAGGSTLPLDDKRRKTFLADMLHDLNKRLNVVSRKREQEIAAVVDETDRSIEATRKMIAEAERRLEAKRRGVRLEPASTTPAAVPTADPEARGRELLEDLATRLLAAEARSAELVARRRLLLEPRPAAVSTKDSAPGLPDLESIAWADVIHTAKSRGFMDEDCPICINPIMHGAHDKHITILSCGHVYHSQCMESLERFAGGLGVEAHCGDGSATSMTAAPAGCKCPVCRSRYWRTTLRMPPTSLKHVVVFAEDLEPDHLTLVKNICAEAFDSPPASGHLHAELAKRIRADLDKNLGGRGWNVLIGRSFGAYVTHRIKCYAYLSVFPGVNILAWRA